MSAVGIIPARYASSRFPGKPLALLRGEPMLLHVVRGARQAKRLRDVIVATDDPRIEALCRASEIPCAMTDASHPTGSDRLAEVAAGLDDEIIVNVQGDEPLIEGFVIDAAVAALEEAPDHPMATIVHRGDADAIDDPNRVKVVLDRHGDALYFSRASIPARRAVEDTTAWFQHVGLYAYRRSFLLEYVTLEPTPLERSEALEQLRVLEHGHRIRCATIEGWHSVGVDTPADLARVEALLAEREAR